MRAARGYGLAGALDVRSGGLITSARTAEFQSALRRGAAAPTQVFRDSLISDAFRSNAAFTPEVMAEVYGLDSLWAGAGQLVDGRRVGRCGGGGCNAPSCNWQYWNIALSCSEANLQAFMFQAPRYVWAQARLNQLLLNPPAPWTQLTNQVIGENSMAWFIWLTEVYKAIALQRWASNLRWELVASKIALPFEGPPSMRSGSGDATPTDPLLQQYRSKVPWGNHAPIAVLMDSPLTWAYTQAGAGSTPDCRPWMSLQQGDSSPALRPLAWNLRVPQAAIDFAPREGLWWGRPTPPPIAAPVRDGRFYSYEYGCDPFGMQYQNNVPEGLRGGLLNFLRRGGGLDADALAMPVWWSNLRADMASIPYTPSPLMQVLIAKQRAEAYAQLEFGTAVSAGLAAWAEMVAAQPESARGVDASTLEALQARMMQNQLNEAAAYVGASFGAAATLATTVIPQPYGAIIGAVIAIVGAVVTALMGAAYDLGLARPDRPPCPPPPVLRMIGSTGSGAEAACDFDQTRRGIEEVAGKSLVVSTLAAGGIPVGAWFPALEALSVRPPDAEPPLLPPPDVREQTPTWKYVAGGLGVGALVLGAATLFGR